MLLALKPRLLLSEFPQPSPLNTPLYSKRVHFWNRGELDLKVVWVSRTGAFLAGAKHRAGAAPGLAGVQAWDKGTPGKAPASARRRHHRACAGGDQPSPWISAKT